MHIDKKYYIIKLLHSNPLELLHLVKTALKTFQYRYIYRCVKAKTIIGKATEIINFSNVQIGKNCLILDHVYIRAGLDGEVIIGDFCAINSFAKLFGHGGIKIGAHSQIGPDCLLTTTTHNYKENLATKFAPITIGERVWIGAKSSILAGVSIGDYSVIGAGSMVIKDIPPYSVAIGTPAKVIKTIDRT